MQTKIKNNQSGFTIIELLIATVVFSVILLIVTEGVIQVSRTYIRGYIGSVTQNANRGILDQISQAIQLSGDNSITIPSGSQSGTWGGASVPFYWFCVNGIKYTYVYDKELTSGGDDVLIADPTSNCSAPDSLSSPPSGSKELLSLHMQLVAPPTVDGVVPGILSAVNDQIAPDLYSLQLNILYGDSGSYDASNDACDPISEGGAFCSVSNISTTVQQRTADQDTID